jgi:hypothetical protein
MLFYISYIIRSFQSDKTQLNVAEQMPQFFKWRDSP